MNAGYCPKSAAKVPSRKSTQTYGKAASTDREKTVSRSRNTWTHFTRSVSRYHQLHRCNTHSVLNRTSNLNGISQWEGYCYWKLEKLSVAHIANMVIRGKKKSRITWVPMASLTFLKCFSTYMRIAGPSRRLITFSSPDFRHSSKESKKQQQKKKDC